MEKQAKENLLLCIKVLESEVFSEEKLIHNMVKKDCIYSIHDVISKIRNYTESLKNLIFRRVISSTYKREINIKEFNEINDCINQEFYNIEEYIDDVLPELYDRNISEFREIYFKLHSSLSMIGYTIKHL